MNEELIKDKLKTHDKRLNDHAGRIDKLEQNQSRVDVKMENLCDQIKQLVSVMKWFMGIWVTSLLGFFFYAVQHNIFR